MKCKLLTSGNNYGEYRTYVVINWWYFRQCKALKQQLCTSKIES